MITVTMVSNSGSVRYRPLSKKLQFTALPNHFIDVIVSSAIAYVLRVGSLDRERRRPIRSRGRTKPIIEVDVSRRPAGRHPPDLAEMAVVGGAVEDVLRVRPGAAVGGEVAARRRRIWRCRRSTRFRVAR
jgi:hypothetical protein